MKRFLTLTDDERTEINRRYKSEKNVRFRERLHSLLLKDQGYSNQEVARLLQVRRETIGEWLTRYETDGLDALCRLEVGGSDSFLTQEQTAQLVTELDTHRFQSAKQVAAWVQEQFGIVYSQRGMRDVLQRLGYSCQKVHLVPAQADMEAQAAFLKGARASPSRTLSP